MRTVSPHGRADAVRDREDQADDGDALYESGSEAEDCSSSATRVK